MVWFSEQKTKRQNQLDAIFETKVFQSKVLFGSAAGFFLLLMALFFGKFAFNIIRSWGLEFNQKVLKLGGKEKNTGYGSYSSPLQTAVRTANPNAKSAGPGPSGKKKLLFCDVLLHFVNPMILPEKIKEAMHLQKQRNPKPKIGEILLETQVISKEELEKTLSVQKRYRQK